MSAEVAVRVQNVSKTYRIYDKPEHRLVQMATLGRVRRFKEFSALKDVSLEVRRGETVGIVGRNGCGKSTLLQIICGTLQPSGGHVEVNGRVAALLELGAGFNGEFTGRENVYMNGAILGFSREEMDARFDQIAAFAGIGDFIERPVKTYSSGMFVRLAFAVATAVEPDILIVDEALAVGDEAFQRKCFARIEAIKERGGTILFVSHSAQSVVQLCDRAILLDAGEKLLDGEPKFVTNTYQRLVNSDAEETPVVRAAISQGINVLGEKPNEHLEELDNEASADVSLSSEYFNTDLQSSPAEVNKSALAKVDSIRLETLDGRIVNQILMGRRYFMRFRVSFTESVENAFASMAVRTIAGLKLFGASTRFVQKAYVSHGSSEIEWDVSFEFTCVLTPGTYFLTAAISKELAGHPHILNRIHDAFAFRVQDEPDLIATGLIDASITPTIHALQNEIAAS